jgi:hypothetical protein
MGVANPSAHRILDADAIDSGNRLVAPGLLAQCSIASSSGTRRKGARSPLIGNFTE